MKSNLLNALATIIRQPKGYQLEPKKLLENLDANQKDSIQQLRDHHELNKYGHEQADSRWESIGKLTPNLFTFIKGSDLGDFWGEIFEPLAINVGSDNDGKYSYTCSYLDTIKSHLKSEYFKNYKQWVDDLIAFESFMLSLKIPSLATQDHSHPRFSTSHFDTLKLEYDIPNLIEQAKEDEDQSSISKLEPIPGDIFLLAFKVLDAKLPKLFHIKKDTYEYILDENHPIPAEQLADLKKINFIK